MRGQLKKWMKKQMNGLLLTDDESIPNPNLSGEQENFQVGDQGTTFQSFIDEIENRWQLEKEALAQKSFDSEAFFAFLDHHFDRPGFVLPEGQLEGDSVKKCRMALNVLDWHKKKHLIIARREQSEQSNMGKIPRDNQDEVAELDRRVQTQNWQMKVNWQRQLRLQNKKRLMMALKGGAAGLDEQLCSREDFEHNSLNAFYNPNMDSPNGMRTGGQVLPISSDYAIPDYEMQLMLLEQQQKGRLMMARLEQSNMGKIPGDNQAGVSGPSGEPFPDTLPQAMRFGTSPNPAEQMNSGTVSDSAQSLKSSNPAMNFLGNHANVSMAPDFYEGAADKNMSSKAAGQNKRN